MKRRVLKKKLKRLRERIKRIIGKDNTYHNILVYFYKQTIINGSKFYVYTASPKIKNGSGTPYRYALWRRNIEC